MQVGRRPTQLPYKEKKTTFPCSSSHTPTSGSRVRGALDDPQGSDPTLSCCSPLAVNHPSASWCPTQTQSWTAQSGWRWEAQTPCPMDRKQTWRLHSAWPRGYTDLMASGRLMWPGIWARSNAPGLGLRLGSRNASSAVNAQGL